MSISIGNRVPDGTLYEYFEQPDGACSIGPNAFQVAEMVKGRKIVVFGLPGAFTPTCSAQHVPSYVKYHDAIKAKGVDDIWCVSVNDAFVMGAWAREEKTAGKVRMFGDGSATWTKALGLEFDLTARGMGVRSQRYVMVLDDGVVKHLAIEAPGKYEVSGAEAVLAKLAPGDPRIYYLQAVLAARGAVGRVDEVLVIGGDFDPVTPEDVRALLRLHRRTAQTYFTDESDAIDRAELDAWLAQRASTRPLLVRASRKQAEQVLRAHDRGGEGARIAVDRREEHLSPRLYQRMACTYYRCRIGYVFEHLQTCHDIELRLRFVSQRLGGDLSIIDLQA